MLPMHDRTRPEVERTTQITQHRLLLPRANIDYWGMGFATLD